MTVWVVFHEQAPAPESDPGRVVPVSRTVPRSPEVATAALNELLRGPTTRERAAGYWSLFSDDTAGMLRGVLVTGGTGFADGSGCPQRHQPLRQHRLWPSWTALGNPTVKGTLYPSTATCPVLHLTPVDPGRPLARDHAAPSKAVTARRGCGPAASCRSGAGTVVAGPRVFTRCATAPPMTPTATACSPPERARRRPGQLGSGRLDRIEDAGLGRPCDRRRPLRPGARPVEPDRTRSGRGRQPLRADVDRHPAGGLERHGDRRHRLHTSATNSWETLPPAPLGPGGPRGAAMVWTGREVVIWSGWSTATASPPYRDGPRTTRPPAPERDRSGPAGHLGARPGPGDRGTVGPAGAEPRLQEL